MRNLPEEGPKHYLLTAAKTDDSVQCVGFFLSIKKKTITSEREPSLQFQSQNKTSAVCARPPPPVSMERRQCGSDPTW